MTERTVLWDCIRCGILWDDEGVPDTCPNCGDRPVLVGDGMTEMPSVLGIFHWKCPDCGETAVTTYKRQPEHICPLYMEPTYRAMVRVLAEVATDEERR